MKFEKIDFFFFFTFFCNDKLIQTEMTKETNASDYHQNLGDCLGSRGLSCVALWSTMQM